MVWSLAWISCASFEISIIHTFCVCLIAARAVANHPSCSWCYVLQGGRTLEAKINTTMVQVKSKLRRRLTSVQGNAMQCFVERVDQPLNQMCGESSGVTHIQCRVTVCACRLVKQVWNLPGSFGDRVHSLGSKLAYLAAEMIVRAR